MLKKIRIKGFRSFSQESFQTVYLQQINFIVGENSSGKSNLLEAIRFALNPSNEGITRNDFSIRKSKNRFKVTDKKATSIEIELTFSNPKKFFPKEVLRGFAKASEVTMRCKVTGRDIYKKEYFIGTKKIQKIAAYKNMLTESAAKKFLSKLQYSVSPIVRSADSIKELKQLLPLGTSSSSRSALMKFSNEVTNQLKRIVKPLLKKSGNQIEIKTDLRGIDAIRNMALDIDVIDEFPVPIQNSGQGLISDFLLRLFLSTHKSGIVAFEEPEIHMHPNKIREFIKTVRKAAPGIQVILTTHSPLLATYANFSEIILVKKTGRYSKAHQMVENLENSADLTRSRFKLFQQYQCTEMLFARGVIFVEGPQDRIAYEMAELGMELSLRENGISIITAGGKDTFRPYVEFCERLQIPWAILFDANAYIDGSSSCGVLKEFENRKWITSDAVNKLLADFQSPKKRKKSLELINEQLRKYHGSISPLPHNDMSDAVPDCLSVGLKKGLISQAWLKDVFVKLGGHVNESDQAKIEDAVKKSAKDTHKMAVILERLPSNAWGSIGASIDFANQAIGKMTQPGKTTRAVIKKTIASPPPTETKAEPGQILANQTAPATA
ncbi:MAG: DNA replication and repair protein RecF [Elusimicrobia bacterium]|nr:DNA replication and repair protein RecF [Elusimicrobiota bacterium]